MRIAIVDDLAAERTLLKDRLEWQLQRRNVQADILEYESGETFLEAARKAPFTAAFLDIYMDGMTGMEAAKKLRKTNTDCLLVFTTTSTDHALEGFQVRALHYLVKPFTEADIDVLSDELLARIPQPDKYMELKVEGSEIHLRRRSRGTLRTRNPRTRHRDQQAQLHPFSGTGRPQPRGGVHRSGPHRQSVFGIHTAPRAGEPLESADAVILLRNQPHENTVAAHYRP